VIDEFFTQYWMFVEALLLHASDLLGVGMLNAAAASLGYPFAAALALSILGITAALDLLWLGRPGWLEASVACARIAAAVLAVALISAMLRKTLRLSREKAPAAP
jgi:hypothetical protein